MRILKKDLLNIMFVFCVWHSDAPKVSCAGVHSNSQELARSLRSEDNCVVPFNSPTGASQSGESVSPNPSVLTFIPYDHNQNPDMQQSSKGSIFDVKTYCSPSRAKPTVLESALDLFVGHLDWQAESHQRFGNIVGQSQQKGLYTVEQKDDESEEKLLDSPSPEPRPFVESEKNKLVSSPLFHNSSHHTATRKLFTEFEFVLADYYKPIGVISGICLGGILTAKYFGYKLPL